ncbi:MAG: CRISPR-associated endonuclease Cas1, partial [Planctomycetaceae bacterium]
MLNEFTYCPRLGYLEWVQGEWAENLETLQGSFGHRNVDKPSRGELPEAGASGGRESTDTEKPSETVPGETIHARSLMLSAPGEGLVAKMDLVELDGNTVTPVDYKRGRVPDIPEKAYEPERVQLCAQGLILRENGYECREGVLYYIASRRRVTVPFDDAFVARTRQLIADFRRTAAEGKLPPPLVDSPKCPRCSLVGICLPDETNLLRTVAPRWDEPHDGHAAPEAAELAGRSGPSLRARPRDGLRRLIPSRDDALPLYLQEHGLSLGKSGEQLVIKKKRETLKKVRLIDVSQVCLFGSAHVTEPALRELVTRGIPVCHFSYGGWFYAITSGLVHKNVELRIRQYAAAADARESLALAKQFVIGKVKNCRTILRRHLEADDKERILWQLNEYVKKAERAQSLESLLGIEGTAAKVYFSGFARLVKGGDEFNIEGRNRR